MNGEEDWGNCKAKFHQSIFKFVFIKIKERRIPTVALSSVHP